MSTRPAQEKAQAEKPGDKSAWVPPEIETLPMRDALGGASKHLYLADSYTFYS